jgi:hypothetical protein
MAILIALGIALASVAFVAAPLFFGGARAARGGAADAKEGSLMLQDLLAEKETLYAAIQELDFDFKSGKLSAEDYYGLRQRYEERAAGLLKAIDDSQAVPETSRGPRRTHREKRRG